MQRATVIIKATWPVVVIGAAVLAGSVALQMVDSRLTEGAQLLAWLAVVATELGLGGWVCYLAIARPTGAQRGLAVIAAFGQVTIIALVWLVAMVTLYG